MALNRRQKETNMKQERTDLAGTNHHANRTFLLPGSEMYGNFSDFCVMRVE
jgi:hypothetical protein